LIDIYTPTDNSTKETPNLVPIVSKYRDCELQKIVKTKPIPVDIYDIFGYYYFCDPKSEEDRNQELTDLTDTILVKINSSFVRGIGLEAVFIGGLYTTTYGVKNAKPDCGELEVKNVGVWIQPVLDYTSIWCNDSFHDYWQNPDKRFDSIGDRKLVINCKVLCCPQKFM
jgi:hypothetical protein